MERARVLERYNELIHLINSLTDDQVAINLSIIDISPDPISSSRDILTRVYLSTPAALTDFNFGHLPRLAEYMKATPYGVSISSTRQGYNDNAYTIIHLESIINLIPPEWAAWFPLHVQEGVNMAAVALDAFLSIVDFEKQIMFIRDKESPSFPKGLLEISRESSPVGTQRGEFEVIEIIEGSDRRICQSGNIRVMTLPYGLISKWGYPIDSDRIPDQLISAEDLSILFRTFDRSEDTLKRHFDMLKIYGGYVLNEDVFPANLIGVTRREWEKNASQYPIYFQYGLPAPPDGLLNRLSRYIRVTLEGLRQKMIEQFKPPYTFDQLVLSNNWEDVFRVVILGNQAVRREFIYSYLGYRPTQPLQIETYVFTLAAIGGLSSDPSKPNPRQIYMSENPETLKRIVAEVHNLLSLTPATYDFATMVQALKSGYLPPPDPVRVEKIRMFVEFGGILGREIEMENWISTTGQDVPVGIRIASSIQRNNVDWFIERYGMVIPFVDRILYALRNAISLDTIETNPEITDRAIITSNGFHRPYVSPEGLRHSNHLPRIMFDRTLLSGVTASGIDVKDRSRLLISIPNGRDYLSQDIISILLDANNHSNRNTWLKLPGMWDILFEAIDVKHNPSYSPYLTSVYHGLTDEEEDMIDTIYADMVK